MSETSAQPGEWQPARPYAHHAELTAFETNLDIALSTGMLDKSLIVRDPRGNVPIVAAIAEEQMHCLTERVRVCGGCANIFVLDGTTVRVIHSTRTTSTDMEDFTGLQNSDVGMLLECLRRRPKGVCIPSTPHKNQKIRLRMGDQTFDTASMPTMRPA